MGWRLTADTAERLRAAISASDAFGSATRAMGERLERAAFERLLGTLGVDASSRSVAAALRRAVGGRVGLPLDGPDELTATLEEVEVSATTLDLCRHLGVDLLRLAASGIDGPGAVADGGRRVTASLTRRDDRPRLDVRVHLSSGVSWSDGVLTARRNGVPAAIAAAIAGRTMDRIVDHDWPGWRDVVATGARSSGGTLVVVANDRRGTARAA